MHMRSRLAGAEIRNSRIEKSMNEFPYKDHIEDELPDQDVCVDLWKRMELEHYFPDRAAADACFEQDHGSFLKAILPGDRIFWFNYDYPMASRAGYVIRRGDKYPNWCCILVS